MGTRGGERSTMKRGEKVEECSPKLIVARLGAQEVGQYCVYPPDCITLDHAQCVEKLLQLRNHCK